MSGNWGIVWARSAEEILAEFPELRIVDEWPTWADAETRRLIEEKDTYDLDADKDKGLLGVIRCERAGSAKR